MQHEKDKLHKYSIDELISTLPSHCRSKLMPVNYPVGHYVFRYGESVKYIWAFSEGHYDFIIYKKDRSQYLDHHDKVCPFAGCMEVLNDIPSYLCTLRVVSPCKGYRLPKALFIEWLNSSEELKTALLSYWASLLCERIYSPFMPISRNLSASLSGFFLQQCTGDSIQNHSYRLNLSRKLLAEKLDVSKRTVYRLLSSFEEKNLISRSGRFICITAEQHELLEEYYEASL